MASCHRMLAFDNSYARLPDRFYARVAPTKVREPRLVKMNHALAELLGLDPEKLDSAEVAAMLGGNALPEGADPIALAYAGHQFGSFVQQLGDGRAILLGEVVGVDGTRRDIQLKGAGRTPFSRGGDGRAALGPVLREYVVSEAMAALGVPTTRALAAVTTGEPVLRDEVLPGAVLTRVATSHMRVGTFEFFAARSDREALATLTTYALSRHYPDAARRGNEALSLLERVVEAQARLVAHWLGVGFVHGVMNTDNTSISGETIDYGPCAFLDEYDPAKKFSSIDRGGRYAFANQPRIALWNLTRLAEALLPLLADDQEDAIRLAKERLEVFPAQFEAAHARVLRAKLGLLREEEDDPVLAADLMERLASNGVDYTIFFRRLCAAATDASRDAEIAAQFAEPGAFYDWAEAWRRRLARENVAAEDRKSAMLRVNPAFIPRNHRVEEMIAAAVQRADFAPFETLVRVLATPYDDQPDFAHLADPPRPDERVRETFCGT
ncbi:MAG TPA: YdiU family protein [Polyangiaceae bacterium]|nr:YdiU family protein [Polyangiaceae bacterium]